MGGHVSYPGLTEDVLEDYVNLTYLTKGEILHLMRKFYSINPAKLDADPTYRFSKDVIVQKFDVLRPKRLGTRRGQRWSELARRSMFEGEWRFPSHQRHWYSRAQMEPSKLLGAWFRREGGRCQAAPCGTYHRVIQNNPFQDRIFRVFSSQHDGRFSFEDMVDLYSAMSSECPLDTKAAWAFRIYDIDDDNQISERDICAIIDRLTWDPSNRNGNYIDRESKNKIANVILDELRLDSTGSIGLCEFKIMMSRVPEFPSSFYFRL